MSITPSPVVRYNTQLMAEDAAILGLTKVAWAKRAGIADMTVIRFLRGQSQTPQTFFKLCKAVKQTPERYVVRSQEAVA